MPDQYLVIDRHPTAAEHRELAKAVGWADHFDSETVPRSLAASLFGVVVTDANGTVVGIPARPVPVDTVHYSPGFVPYGTPCGENCDPAYARIAELEAQLETIAKQMSDLEARNQPAPKAKSA